MNNSTKHRTTTQHQNLVLGFFRDNRTSQSATLIRNHSEIKIEGGREKWEGGRQGGEESQKGTGTNKSTEGLARGLNRLKVGLQSA